MASHNDTGNTGESMAFDWIQLKGYEVLHRQWRHGRKEVDLIATKDGVLHFIEVKTRRSKSFGEPEKKADQKKISLMMKAAEEYLAQGSEWKKIQFNILSITIIPGKPVEYFFIEDVYL